MPSISPQCRRILAVLEDGLAHPSSEIIAQAYDLPVPCSVSFTRRVSDLRQLGYDIRAERIEGQKQRAYRLVRHEMDETVRTIERVFA